MSTKFPLKYEVTAAAAPGIMTPWQTQVDALTPIDCAIPPEFSGPGGPYSPEDLFAMSILNSMVALFKFLCDKKKVSFKEIKSKATLSVDKNAETNQIHMNEIYISFSVSGASDIGEVKEMLEQAIRDCPIGNSVKTGKSFQISVL